MHEAPLCKYAINYANQIAHRSYDTLSTKKLFHSREENFRDETKFSIIKQKVFAGRNPYSVAILLTHLNTFNIITLTQGRFSVIKSVWFFRFYRSMLHVYWQALFAVTTYITVVTTTEITILLTLNILLKTLKKKKLPKVVTSSSFWR